MLIESLALQQPAVASPFYSDWVRAACPLPWRGGYTWRSILFAIQIDQGQLPETDITSEPSAYEQVDEGGGETREYVPWYGMERLTYD